MKFNLTLTFNPPEHYVELAKAADELGWDTVNVGDGLFFFDFQLGAMYPSVPPTCHYISYCTDRLNPNLYEDGKVCVRLLGTWNGKDTS